MVAYAYNPSYSEWKLGGPWFEASPGKKFARAHLN
jgi:hypothetical protein